MTDTAARRPEWQNLFGVCACIGEDLGIDPLWLRIAFAIALIWFPAITLGTYAALGLVVLATRLLFPNPRIGTSTNRPWPALVA